MIEEKDITPVGKFQRTHALKGELNLILDIDPEFFEEGANPMIVEMDGCLIPFYAESIRTKGQTSYLVKLERIDTEEQARQYVNKTVNALKSELKDFMAEMGEDLFTSDDWNGFEVVDSTLGNLGKLERIDDSTANILMVIETPEGDELYIPLAEEFLEDVDNDSRVIKVNLPDGLVDLNKKKDEIN